MRGPSFLSLGLLIALAACSPGGQEDPSSTADNGGIINDAESIPTAPDNAATNDTAGAPPVAAAPVQADATRIPPALRGRWGLVPKDCTSLHGDAKGLLEISPNTLMFFESRGTLKRILEREPTRIRADFSFEGEGMTWESDITFTVQDNGTTLIRQDKQPEEGAPALYHYSRCKS